MSSDRSEPVLHQPDPTSLRGIAKELQLVLGRVTRQSRQQSVDGLTLPQLSALASIGMHGPLRLGELARLEVVDPSTLTRVVARLEGLHLVERSTDPADGRSAFVRLTDRGAEKWRTAHMERNSFLAERLALLGDEDLAKIAAVMPVLVRLLEGEGARPEQ